jgi:hypothetical protein
VIGNIFGALDPQWAMVFMTAIAAAAAVLVVRELTRGE